MFWNRHKSDLIKAWEQVKTQCELNDFLAVAASERGWDIQWMLKTIIEYEEKQQASNNQPRSKKPLTYAPAFPPVKQAETPDKPLLYQGDIISELANLTAHLLIVTRTRAGKSTLLLTVIHKGIDSHKGLELYIVDPKTTNWLGLQRIKGVVTYLTDDINNPKLAIEQAEPTIKKVYGIFAERKALFQQHLMGKGSKPSFHPVWLIIDEWYSLYDKIKRVWKDSPIINWLNEIVAQGAELGIHLILVAQSHLVSEIGFSTTMRRCFEFVCLGAISASFEPILAAVADANLFALRQQREELVLTANYAIRHCGKRRVILTTQGTPKIAILPDLSWVHHVVVELPESYSQDKSVTELSQVQRQVDERFTSVTELVTGNSGNSNQALEGYKALYKAVTMLQQMGVSDTRIVKEVLGQQGRNFDKGKQAYLALLQLGRQRGW